MRYYPNRPPVRFPSLSSSLEISRCLLGLEKLVLRHVGLKVVSSLALCPKLKSLGFCGRADLSMLAAVPELHSLKVELLIIRMWDTSDLDLSSLRTLTKCERLEVVSGLARTATLPPLPSLQHLDVLGHVDVVPISERQLSLSRHWLFKAAPRKT